MKTKAFSQPGVLAAKFGEPDGSFSERTVAQMRLGSLAILMIMRILSGNVHDKLA